MTLYGCGITSANVFDDRLTSIYEDKITKHIKLRGLECNEHNILDAFHEILKDLNNEHVIIYYSGHGDHSCSKEYWQTSGGIIDQIRIATLVNEVQDDSCVFIFSESCSSEHMCNTKVAKHNYVSIGATQDYEDAIITCDGGVMTCVISEIFKTLETSITIDKLWNAMLESGVDIEHFSLRYSDEKFLKTELN